MKRAFVALLLLASPVVMASSSGASCQASDCGPPAVGNGGSEEILVTGSRQNRQDEVTHHGHFPGPHPPVVTYIIDPQLRTDPLTNEPCAYLAQTPGDPNSPQALTAETRARQLIAAYGLCTNSPRPSTNPTPAAAAAEAFEKHIKLPTPTLQIRPGYSITGTRAFLQINGPQQLDPDPIDVFGYTVTLHITSRYDIDWGDRTTPTTGATSQGGPYPNGDLSHVYDNTGTYTVTVTQHWTATYNIAGTATGHINDVLHTTNTMPLPVHQAQAVVDG